MEVSIRFEDNLISDDQAETFAYNIYRDIAEYMKENYVYMPKTEGGKI